MESGPTRLTLPGPLSVHNGAAWASTRQETVIRGRLESPVCSRRVVIITGDDSAMLNARPDVAETPRSLIWSSAPVPTTKAAPEPVYVQTTAVF